MDFEYDPEKNQTNKTRHGLDFEEAKQIWEDIHRLEVPVTQLFAGEERNLMIGRISDKIWTAVFTRRGDAIRLISVRRSRKNEGEAYGRK